MSHMQELGPNQERWLQALESGKYQQGSGFLCEDNKFCCLGVWADLNVEGEPGVCGTVKYNGCASFLDDALTDELGLNGGFGYCGDTSLADMNDSGNTFAEIAQFCRDNPEKVFKEAK